MTVSAPRPKLASAMRVSKPARKWYLSLLAILLCQSLAIGFVETVLWCAAMGEEEIFHFDPQIGFVHMHNKRITWRTEGFAQSYLNADGLREPDVTVAKPANTYRVALLGDSLAEGLQVPIEQTFGQIIANRLTPLAGKKVQFLNFGTSGYSTVQEYLLLKRSVMAYKPDLVLVCYSSRDIFENWTAPDQVITNVRPIALQLPGRKLVIDSLPVRRWLRSPRGQFMLATNWLREHSRILGLLAELDLDLSQHNRFYRALVDAVSHPKNAGRDLQEAVASLASNGPSFQINVFEDTARKPAVLPANYVDGKVLNSASGNESLRNTAALNVQPVAKTTPKEDPYRRLIGQTLASLFQEMRATCTAGDCRFAVVSVPSRAQLCPLPESETQFNGIDYAAELDIVRSICAANHIPFCNTQAEAEKLAPEARPKLFYAVHLTPEGQKFIADVLQPFVRQLLIERSRQGDTVKAG